MSTATPDQNPPNFTPLRQLEVCSNLLIGAGHIIGFNRFAPIIIGKGADIPLVWLYARVKDQWVPFVAESRSLHEDVLVTTNVAERLLLIIRHNVVMLKAKMLTDDSCLVDQIDLRPVGINITGSSQKLWAGSNQIYSNTFVGVRFMVGINESFTVPLKDKA